MRKTYHIRKVQGGGVSTVALKKKKRVLVSFPHPATPLEMLLDIERSWACLEYSFKKQLKVPQLHKIFIISNAHTKGVVSQRRLHYC